MPDTATSIDRDALAAIAAALKILSRFGASGQLVWENAKSHGIPRERLACLHRALRHFRSLRGNEDRYVRLPVDVRTFIESDRLLNMGDEVYPKIIREIEDLCSGKYVEAVLTGGIGSGKTTVALIVTAYYLYVLSCLENPHAEFGLARSSEIIFVFQSMKEKTAKGVDYMRFRSMINNSAYFQQHFRYDKGIESQLNFPNRVIVMPLSGDHMAAIGQNVFGGIIDEIDFMAVVENSKVKRDGGVFDQAKEMYSGIARRRQSRFMKQGRLPGMLCLVSSKNYPGAFTDRKQEEARGNPTIFVYDKRVWEVKPEGTFSGEWFPIFVGDATRKPSFLSPEAAEALRGTDDAPLVMDIPAEYRRAFSDDMLAALRDVAGVSTQALHPFMLNTETVKAAFGRVPGVVSRPDVDFKTAQLMIFPKRIVSPDLPRFAHVDLAISGDSCGLAVGHVPHFTEIRRGEREREILPVIRFDVLLEIRPPRGGEIEFEKVRSLLYKLREAGMTLKWVTFDSFQSTDSVQILRSRGFMSGTQSMDMSTTAYDVAKQAIYDGRVSAPEHERALSEWTRLERNPKTNKIDHPPHGSKDVSDAMAGVIFGLTMRREIWVRNNIPPIHIPKSLVEAENKGKGSISRQEAAGA